MVTSSAQLLRIYQQQLLNLADTQDPDSDGLLVLLTRDELSQHSLSTDEFSRLKLLDDELARQWQLYADLLPFAQMDDEPSRWWWHLHTGPQVRPQQPTVV